MSAAVLLIAGTAQASFGIARVSTGALNRDGTIDLMAGSHPYEYTFGFEMGQDAGGDLEGTLGGAFFYLPPGLIGNPLAAGRCTRAELERTACPGSAQIGMVHSDIEELGGTEEPLYNLVPPSGKVAIFGFNAGGFIGVEQISMRAGRDYGFTVSDAPVPIGGVESISETIWGVPSDPGHDAERICIGSGGSEVDGCASEGPPGPLLTLPVACGDPLETKVEVESVEEPGVLVGATAFSLDPGGDPASLAGCEALPFRPAVMLQPNTTVADSPSGPSIDLRVPQAESPEGVATADVRSVNVDLPDGMSVDLSAAASLAACSPAQIGLETEPGATPAEFSAGPAGCSAASQIGTVKIDTPLLKEPLEGVVYVATQYENPFGSLFALYIAAYDPTSGVVIKLPGSISLDPQTGSLEATFTELPQLPFEDLRLEFLGGSGGILVTPAACGTYVTRADLTPSGAPQVVMVTSSSFRLTGGPGGSPCPSSESELPFRPSFDVSPTNVLAGSSSSFVLKLSRGDGTQRISQFSVALPRGVGAKFAGIPYCPEADIQSCPTGSEVGTVSVVAGVGPSPLLLGGHVYLSGPYKGAPLSLVIVTPAVAGPFDLGTVAVRAALYVDAVTGQIRVVSDRFPTILRGVPLNLRTISIELDRPGFMVNPTSCEPMAVTGEATSVSGQVTSMSVPYQVGGCQGLALRPNFSVRLRGPTHRGAHPTLRTVITPRRGDANLAGVAVTLPATELLENRHIRTVCSAALSIDQCPRGSAYGRASVWSPLLDEPLTGPVYLRASSHRLPDLVASLGGQVHLDLTGRLSSVHGRLRTTFHSLPDLPMNRFILTLQGGKRGLLVDSGGICTRSRRAGARFAAHSGRTRDIDPVVKTDCRANTA